MRSLPFRPPPAVPETKNLTESYRKKAIAKQRRYERACKRIAGFRVAFYEKGEAREQSKAFRRKTKTGELCFDALPAPQTANLVCGCSDERFAAGKAFSSVGWIIKIKSTQKGAFYFGEPSEIRTPDTLIKSQVLCRLS